MPFVLRPSRNKTLQLAFELLRAQERKEKRASAPAAVAIPKEEPTRPGKRTATKDEKAWMDAVAAYGCIACHIDGVRPRPTAIHHLLRGGQRIGHKHTIGLCDPGHHQGGKLLGLVSRHPDKAQFEKKYGTEAQLLKRTQKVLKKQKDGSYAP